MTIRKSIGILILAVTVTSGLLFAGSRLCIGAEPQMEVTVLFFNDIHGHLLPYKVKTARGKEEVGGIARLTTLIKSIKAERAKMNIPTFVLFAGDMLQGTPISTVYRGRAEVECFNTMVLDAMTVGNHEFDFGLQNFLNLKAKAAFPVLSSNIVWKDSGELLCDPMISFELDRGISLTIIGVTTDALLTTTKPTNVERLAVLDSVGTVKKAFDQVRDRGPAILLSHSKHKTDRAIAQAIPELAAIIGGHDQILFSPFRKVGDVPIFQAFEKGRYIGRLDLKINPITKKARLLSSAYIPVTADIEPDPDISQIVARFHGQLNQKFKEVIGHSAVFLDGERDRVRYEETNLGNFVTDIMRQFTGADISLLNSGSLRASIDKGPITLEDVFKTMPYTNEIVLVELTGREIQYALTRSVQGNREDEDGGFLQVSGIRFTIRGHGVEGVRLHRENTPIDPDRTYRVAITDFLGAGGDGYALFAAKEKENTGLPLREVIADTIRSRKSISAHADHRIVRMVK